MRGGGRRRHGAAAAAAAAPRPGEGEPPAGCIERCGLGGGEMGVFVTGAFGIP